MLKDRGFETLDDVNKDGMASDETIRKMPSYHCIVLAKNDIGRINLYRLISMSHLQVLLQKTKDPKEPVAEISGGSDHRLSL